MAANGFARPIPKEGAQNEGPSPSRPKRGGSSASLTTSDGVVAPAGSTGKGGKVDPRKKKFDPAGVLSKLQSELPILADKAKEKASQHLDKAAAKLEVIKSTQYVEPLKPAIQLLETRRDALKACLDGDSAFAAFKDKYAQQLKEAGKTHATDAALGKGWETIDSFDTMKASMLKIRIEHEDDEKKERSRAKALLLKFEDLAGAVRDQLSRVSSTFDRRVKAADAETKKEGAKKRKAEEQAQIQRPGKKQLDMAPGPPAIYTIDLSAFGGEITSVKYAEASAESLDVMTPCLVTDIELPTELEPALERLKLSAFLGAFVKGAVYKTGSGRGAQQIMADCSILNSIVEKFRPAQEATVSRLQEADRKCVCSLCFSHTQRP